MALGLSSSSIGFYRPKIKPNNSSKLTPAYAAVDATFPILPDKSVEETA